MYYINCPCCNEPLINEWGWVSSISKKDYLIKSCYSKLNHKFDCTSIGDDILNIALYIKDTKIIWNYAFKKVFINMKNLQNTNANQWRKKSLIDNDLITIPWFEPNFSEYHNILKKIKTYIIFS